MMLLQSPNLYPYLDFMHVNVRNVQVLPYEVDNQVYLAYAVI